MKKILIDIYHLPQYNFLKNTILAFDPREVDLFCVNRGKLLQVIRHELPDYPITCIGDYKHNKGSYSMAFRIILPRLFRLFRMVNRKKYGFVLTAHYQANFIAWLKRIPNIAFNDDPRKYVFQILKLSANEVYLPPFGFRHRGIKVFNALKEWAYLSPKYFSPDTSFLKLYDLTPKKYVFIREVSTKTSNYLHQTEDIILSISKNFPPDLKVVLSLEDKNKKEKYPDHWICLQEPVGSIHSLMYYSQAVVSSGDSMAREGAILGVPSIYAGSRDMPANQIMIDKGMLLWKSPAEVVSTVKKIVKGQLNFEDQVEFRNRLVSEWEDITDIILEKLQTKHSA